MLDWHRMRILLTFLLGVALVAGYAASQPAEDLTDVVTFELACDFLIGFSKAQDLNRVLTHVRQAAQTRADERGCGPVELVRFECLHLYHDFYDCHFSFGRWVRSEQGKNNP